MIYRFLALSLIVHFLLTATMLRLEAPALQRPRTIDVTYIDELPQQKKEPKQLVQDPNSEKLTESLKKLADQVDRISRETQRVQEEQVARRKDSKTQNASDRNTQTGRQASRGNRAAEGEGNGRSRSRFPRPQDVVDVSDGPSIDRPMGGKAAAHVQLSESTISDYVPEVKEGGFTSLNTDQFLYYTFYARIGQQISNRWTQHLRTFFNNASPQMINRLSQNVQTTELEVLLDKEGNFQDIIFHRRAENSDLDIAAGAALERSSPFLNPPSELVQKDGFIHLYYSFNLTLRPQYIAKP